MCIRDSKMVEAMDKAEYPEQIRAMAQLGANPIYAMFDTVNEVVLDVADEFPDTKFYLIDCEMENSEPNCANLIVDPYEASFIAGFVAAKTTAVSYTHLRAHETRNDLVCRLLLEKKKTEHTIQADVELFAKTHLGYHESAAFFL